MFGWSSSHVMFLDAACYFRADFPGKTLTSHRQRFTDTMFGQLQETQCLYGVSRPRRRRPHPAQLAVHACVQQERPEKSLPARGCRRNTGSQEQDGAAGGGARGGVDERRMGRTEELARPPSRTTRCCRRTRRRLRAAGRLRAGGLCAAASPLALASAAAAAQHPAARGQTGQERRGSQAGAAGAGPRECAPPDARRLRRSSVCGTAAGTRSTPGVRAATGRVRVSWKPLGLESGRPRSLFSPCSSLSAAVLVAPGPVGKRCAQGRAAATRATRRPRCPRSGSTAAAGVVCELGRPRKAAVERAREW